jgi:hypothetical protein
MQQVQPIPDMPDFEAVVDGFFEDFRLRPQCLSYLPLALGHNMLPVRMAFGDRRPRYVQVPSQSSLTISSTGFYEEQVSVIPGSILWGISVIGPIADPEEDSQLINYSLRITDLQTGFEIFSEFSGLEAFDPAATNAEGGVFVLPEPYIFTDPGVFMVEIGARDVAVFETTLPVQILLFFSEAIQTCDTLHSKKAFDYTTGSEN